MGRITLDTRCDPERYEGKWYNVWLENGYFHPVADADRVPFSIVIPPPNITDVLHLGHALNNTLQDLFIRWKRMEGYNTLWLPGTDHAGIATQHMVVEGLRSEGKTKEDIGREKFVELLWDWKRRKGGRIVEQLKLMGSSCDWERERFTMDEMLSRAVREVFVRLYNEGLIYRGKYIINWCPKCLTALSDDEVTHKEQKGHLWYLRYPFKGRRGDYVVVATTRPETMLGDTAVAVNPSDDRYKGMIGETLVLPIIGREIPVIADEMVDPEFGTGAVKVTPAHDPNDFEIGKKHGLPSVVVMDENALMNENAGDFAGLDRYDAREKIVERMKSLGLIERIEDYTHSVGHCYRCHTEVEPYLSDQWFVRMKPLSEPAIAVVERGIVRFHPPRWKKVYLEWMHNIKDWCISRQIWWGHRIPVWWCDECGGFTVAVDEPKVCSHCGSNRLHQDSDVLDTWFSSWLWPFSTMGWPAITDDLQYFYPTDILVTAPEIIFFWVARMIMAGIHFTGQVPFFDVLIHGTVRDKLGRKMSKSLGNGIDPVEVIEKYGKDALRYTLISQSTQGQDLFISVRDFELGRNFVNKLWNAVRFAFLNIDGQYNWYEIQDISPTLLVNRWILSRLEKAKAEISNSLSDFRVGEASRRLYQFFWNEFCDWYLEGIKPVLAKQETKPEIEKTLLYTIDNILRLYHPIIPFVTEELWQKLKENYVGGMESKHLIVADWPDPYDFYIDEDAEREFELTKQIVYAIRNIRGELSIPRGKKAEAFFVLRDKSLIPILERNNSLLLFLAELSDVKIVDRKPDGAVGSAIMGDVELYIPLAGLVDIESEVRRIRKEIERLSGILSSTQRRLSDANFTKKAPEEVVDRERKKVDELRAKIDKLNRTLSELTSI
ncbi:valine--tRNA ligase [bacterium]|nr:valine--tRNA ligase [bacterium]